METFHNNKSESRKITISDVAEALNVSKTTVSRAISGKGRISEETRQKVLAYIEENDYKPNVIAQGLAQQKTYNIALAVPGDCNLEDMPFFQNSMQGVCEEALAHDYDVMLVTIANGCLDNIEHMVAKHKADGVILSRPMVKDKAADFLKERHIPFVLMGASKDREILQVDNNHKAGCRELVGRLIRSGIKHIGLIGGGSEYVVNHTRLQGYREAVKAGGILETEQLIFCDCNTLELVEFAVNRLWEEKVECIVCMDDVVCLMVLQVLARNRISVPEQMQVASFYDSRLLMYNKPAVTSLVFDDKALGTLACSVLLSYIRGEEVRGRTLLDYEIASRDSTMVI